jgi:RNA polymerase sigma-70 factor (ECF subfamily)
MPTTLEMNAGFDIDLGGMLPRLLTYALSLKRNSDRADEPVQQTGPKALASRASFRSGTNFAAWVFRIDRNEFISELRRARPTVDIDSPSCLRCSSSRRRKAARPCMSS